MNVKVTVYVTAWVERSTPIPPPPPASVTVHVTAWVERISKATSSDWLYVTVHVTAWVESLQWSRDSMIGMSQYMWQRELKEPLKSGRCLSVRVTVHVTAWVERDIFFAISIKKKRSHSTCDSVSSKNTFINYPEKKKTLPGIPFLPLIASQYMWQRELKITNNHFVKEVTSQYMWHRELKGYGMES